MWGSWRLALQQRMTSRTQLQQQVPQHMIMMMMQLPEG
jgi:hypothetical protein